MTPDEKTIEQIARAIAESEGRNPDELQFPSEFEDMPGMPVWEGYAGFARKLLVALDAIEKAKRVT